MWNVEGKTVAEVFSGLTDAATAYREALRLAVKVPLTAPKGGILASVLVSEMCGSREACEVEAITGISAERIEVLLGGYVIPEADEWRKLNEMSGRENESTLTFYQYL